MAERFALYDFNLDEMATRRVYKTLPEAVAAADGLNDVMVAGLGDVSPDGEPDEEEANNEEEDDRDPVGHR